MRFVEIARAAALVSCAGLLSACPKKDTEATPEPAAPAAVQAPVSDKAGAEPPAAAAPGAAAPAAPAAAAAKKKADEDKGGW
jgi:hypothetical protein